MKSPMNRPTIYDHASVAATAKQLLNPLKEWLGGESKSYDDEKLINDLHKAMDDSFELGAYKLAREFERMGYDPDFALVQVLSKANPIIYQETGKRVKQWVIDMAITPTFAVGDKVKALYQRKTVEGEIARINAEKAEYTVFCESLGHVKTGCGINGLIVGFEKVEAR